MSLCYNISNYMIAPITIVTLITKISESFACYSTIESLIFLLAAYFRMTFDTWFYKQAVNFKQVIISFSQLSLRLRTIAARGL